MVTDLLGHYLVNGAPSDGMAGACVTHAKRLVRRLCLCVVLAGSTAAVFAQDLAERCRRPTLANVASAEQVERAAEQQYADLLARARSQNALAPGDHPQAARLRYVLERMLPFTEGCNERALKWNWEISLIGSKEPRFQGLPAGKIVVFHGLLRDLQLDDDEVAALVAHAMARSLLELERERLANVAMRLAALGQGSAVPGPEAAYRPSLEPVNRLTSLQLWREQGLRADKLGLYLAAKAGYQPRAFASLWRKMPPPGPASTPPFLAAQHSAEMRATELERWLVEAGPIYEQAVKPDRRFSPPAR